MMLTHVCNKRSNFEELGALLCDKMCVQSLFAFDQETQGDQSNAHHIHEEACDVPALLQPGGVDQTLRAAPHRLLIHVTHDQLALVHQNLPHARRGERLGRSKNASERGPEAHMEAAAAPDNSIPWWTRHGMHHPQHRCNQIHARPRSSADFIIAQKRRRPP